MLYNGKQCVQTSVTLANGGCIDLIMTMTNDSCLCSNTFETGFSDFHHVVYITLKSTYARLPPKVVSYRCYRSLSETHFREELAHKMYENLAGYAESENLYVSTLNSLVHRNMFPC